VNGNDDKDYYSTPRLWKMDSENINDLQAIIRWYVPNYHMQADRAERLSRQCVKMYEALQKIERVANRSSVEYNIACTVIKEVL